jgi:hypothetical protein
MGPAAKLAIPQLTAACRDDNLMVRLMAGFALEQLRSGG